METIIEFSSVVSVMEEIKHLQRHNAAWDILPDRCSAARRALIEIKGASPDLTED